MHETLLDVDADMFVDGTRRATRPMFHDADDMDDADITTAATVSTNTDGSHPGVRLAWTDPSSPFGDPRDLHHQLGVELLGSGGPPSLPSSGLGGSEGYSYFSSEASSSDFRFPHAPRDSHVTVFGEASPSHATIAADNRGGVNANSLLPIDANGYLVETDLASSCCPPANPTRHPGYMVEDNFDEDEVEPIDCSIPSHHLLSNLLEGDKSTLAESRLD